MSRVLSVAQAILPALADKIVCATQSYRIPRPVQAIRIDCDEVLAIGDAIHLTVFLLAPSVAAPTMEVDDDWQRPAPACWHVHDV